MIESASPVSLESPSLPCRTRDDIDNDFADAILHRPGGHRVLGLKLRPFSYWHAACLDFLCSPFVAHAGPCDFAALWVAARVCQMRYPAIPRHSRFEYLRELHAAWKYNQRLRVENSAITSPYLEELNKFFLYLRDYNTRPTFGSTSESVSINCPWFLYETSLLRHFNPRLTIAQAWDTPVAAGAWENVGATEAAGHRVLIETPEDRKAQREAADPDADNRAVFDEASNTWRSVPNE